MNSVDLKGILFIFRKRCGVAIDDFVGLTPSVAAASLMQSSAFEFFQFNEIYLYRETGKGKSLIICID